MSRCSDRAGAALALALALTGAGIEAASAGEPRFGFGKPATAEEVAGWDIDVRPDGHGLPPGRGSAAQGQAIYDAKCASCHGTFGESTDYMPIAGGVGTLGTDQPIRTTGSKLNHATTLWDYINRAMPFGNPKTLAPDEVYALTAYVLHLNDIIPIDAALDRDSIVKLRMPNRDGFTTAHGLRTRDGKPDTRNVACMRDCVSEVRLSSQMPEHARNAHGNLAEQTRSLGSAEVTRTVAAPAAKPQAARVADLAKSAGCTACHGVTQKIVGPAFRDIGGRYVSEAGAEDKLVTRVRRGGAGVWGAVPMPAQAQLGDADVRALVRWILAGSK